ncbi:MAG TPA: hypothetical protein VKP30_25995, partial [Polyangiaceae bacterium]|nr:hypothetical protein [Polyangiaceae bacterium]
MPSQRTAPAWTRRNANSINLEDPYVTPIYFAFFLESPRRFCPGARSWPCLTNERTRGDPAGSAQNPALCGALHPSVHLESRWSRGGFGWTCCR